MIAAGALRQVVDIERWTVTSQDANGEDVGTWVLLITARAKIEPLSGKELVEARQLNEAIAMRITVRYANEIKDLTAKDRIVLGSRILNILGSPVNANLRNEEWVISVSDKGETR